MRLMASHGIHHGHSFKRGIVVQTQNHHIHIGQQGAFGFGVFALGWVNADQLDLWQQGQALANLQTSGARLAVNKNLSHGEKSFAKKQR